MMDLSDQRKQGRAHRTETVPAPRAPFARTGVDGLGNYPEHRVPDIPRAWTAEHEAVAVTAAEADEPAFDARLFGRRVRLAAGAGPERAPRADLRERPAGRRREGIWGAGPRRHDSGGGTRPGPEPSSRC
ncbi:hypothetical protein [Streptomyces sp. NPDC056291]|uniref:hypothetical protein n=1 Tax=unclassified Streptomyces TaxID=2593676 RepID=UPI0035DD7190